MYRPPFNCKRPKLSLLALAIVATTLVAAVLMSTVYRGHFSQTVRAAPKLNMRHDRVLVAAPVTPQLLKAATQPAHDYSIPPIVNGAVPVISHIPTTEKVAFLTIDDGIVTDPSDAQLMQAANTKATLFLVYRFINTDYSFFSDLAARTGSDIENHTYDHYLLTNLTYEQQKLDICKNADIFSTWFGRRPVLLRPSGGAYNTTTLRAAADCGMKALVMWDATINNGVIRYQDGTKMQPGDIVLMHFRSTYQEDLTAFVQAAHSSGLQPDLLINWL